MKLFRKYGTNVQSVEIDFDARAMTEIGFRRDRKESIPLDELEAGFELVETRELQATSEGPVQYEAEVEILAKLEAQLRSLHGDLGDDEILVMLNEQGVDYPKLHDRKRGVIVDGENQLYFYWSVDPPLRMARYRRR